MPLAEQLEHHWLVHSGPLVLGTDLLKYPAPTKDRDQLSHDVLNPAHVPL